MSKRLEAWVFLRSGAERTHFGEVRYRLEGDTPMSDTSVFEEGWERAHWLDSDRGTRWDRLKLPADRQALIQRAVAAADGACSIMAPAPEVSEGDIAAAVPSPPVEQAEVFCSPHQTSRGWRCESHNVEMSTSPTCLPGLKQFWLREARSLAPAPDVSEGAPAGAAPLAPTAGDWREIARQLVVALQATGPWHAGCGCNHGSRGERSAAATCLIDVALRNYAAALSSPPSAPAASGAPASQGESVKEHGNGTTACGCREPH